MFIWNYWCIRNSRVIIIDWNIIKYCFLALGLLTLIESITKYLYLLKETNLKHPHNLSPVFHGTQAAQVILPGG